jgi:hypothetical protein
VGVPGVRVIRQHIRPVATNTPIVVIAQEWPCWLSVILALQLPVVTVFVQPVSHNVFMSFDVAVPWCGLDEWEDLFSWPSDWDFLTILGSGSVLFVDTILPKLRGHHNGVLLSALDIIAHGCKSWDLHGIVLSRCPWAGGGLVREILLGFLMRERCK